MRSLRTALHGTAFALTGVGTALLGSTLPATLQHWQLPDSRGGLLLLAAWGGSTAGALLARGRVERSAVWGMLLSAVALLGMASPTAGVLLISYLLYGLGLGTTMTSLSLLRSRGASEQQAGVELNRLNLLWAVGACLAPALALRSLRLLSVALLFRLVASVFAGLALLLWALAFTSAGPQEPAATVRERQGSPSQLPWAPLRFCFFAAASVGLESAIGSWLTTYTERFTQTVTTAVSANAAFWVGLLISRGVYSLPGRISLGRPSLRALHLLATGVALALLLGHPTPMWMALAGGLCGVGLGPLYPWVLSIALPRYRSTAVFVLAGVGASLVPWLTGVLSSHLGSLRLGLLAPLMALGALLLTTLGMRHQASGERPLVG